MTLQLVKQLIADRNDRVSRSFYDWNQVQLAYHNNKLEGSNVSLDQTVKLFRQQRFLQNKQVRLKTDDEIETLNHFQLFDLLIDTVQHPLTLNYIKQLQGTLKQGTVDDQLDGQVVGDFKQIPNEIAYETRDSVITASVQETPSAVQHLIDWWEAILTPKLADYAAFHFRFEMIHPFSDGNGRIGRLLLFKELCRHNDIPLIILAEDRSFYLRGLQEFRRNPGYLIDTIGDAIDTYAEAMSFFQNRGD